MQNKPDNHDHPQQDWAQYTNMAVGDILRRTREYYGLRIEDVERALRIRSSQLAALEEGHVEKLPGRVYAIGFVRAYAEFLGLDGDKMVHLFKAQLVGHKPRPELNFPVPASESKVPNFYILGGAAAGLVLLTGVIVLMSGPKKSHEIPQMPAEVKQEMAVYGPPAPQNFASVEPAAGPAALMTVPESRITIGVVDSAWVEIRNAEGKALISRILEKGDSYIVPNEQGMEMDTGNIGALEFTVDGKKIAKLGETGIIKRSVSLDPDKLKLVVPAAVVSAAIPVPPQTPAPVAAKPATAAVKPASAKAPVKSEVVTKKTTPEARRSPERYPVRRLN